MNVWSLVLSGTRFAYNLLELKECLLSLLSLCSHLSNVHIRVHIDNVVAVPCIDKLGGMKSSLCNMTRQIIMFWCIEEHIHFSVVHILGTQNVVADKLPRINNFNLEWKSNSGIFLELVDKFGQP